ncbi:N-acetylmuramoyl-L-alanine amidase [Rhodobium orientis]|uniref:1,6-anhydro-N-acetylmuramyl-L-alanine amidase AmpD n=1 Tax=Rhodobium orientis TaxID=34017 RepID=A0A327K0Y6_9HYPH|nr:N-acetylmuramoyl-L-alanine amidase [Rhodobium orientis]MBB4302334.1 N-acetylmuramoyl-L-alanine amidase [Rhodobium orientis]MBK5949040.1 N-acetylmuramoyl-L-alanine amidase [Rhodobium orientis]RAI29028.1 N-acetylmuramoyl-L-alanine amidase [Rhodobium orientis]
MEFQIKNHRIEGIPFQAARWTGGTITPIIIVCHDTASRLDPLSAARYLQDNTSKVSVQFVVERDGHVTQLVACNKRANHAGKSTYHGRQYCNGFSIGIEIVNPGIMQDAGGGKARAWYGKTFDIEEYGIREVSTREHGSGFWMPYPEAQIEAVEAILVACVNKYSTIKDVTTHWYVSPGRKVDTNPLFPLGHLKSRAFGREDPAEDEADAAAAPVEDGDATVSINVPGDTLNMRRWPSFNPNVLAAIPHGTRVPLIKTGTFNRRTWHKVVYGGQEGWVVASYTE